MIDLSSNPSHPLHIRVHTPHTSRKIEDYSTCRIKSDLYFNKWNCFFDCIASRETILMEFSVTFSCLTSSWDWILLITILLRQHFSIYCISPNMDLFSVRNVAYLWLSFFHININSQVLLLLHHALIKLHEHLEACRWNFTRICRWKFLIEIWNRNFQFKPPSMVNAQSSSSRSSKLLRT